MTYRTATAQALGVMRRCFMRHAGIEAGVPIWVTENGVPTTAASAGAGAEQAGALRQLVGAVRDYSGAFNVTDYRWFNLRDSRPQPLGPPPLFSTDGLLRSDYTRKPAFSVLHGLIAALGRREPGARPPTPDKKPAPAVSDRRMSSASRLDRSAS